MDFLESMQEGEEELKRQEARTKEIGPPPGMTDQAWLVDRAYLLFALRLFSRKIYYGLWARQKNIGLEDADFAGMHLILQHRAKEVKKEPVLQAYLRVTAALQLDPEASATPMEIERTLIYVVNARPKIDREDYVFLTTYLFGYAVTAYNKQQGDYAVLALQTQVPCIEGKYGIDWPGNPPLPYRFVVNLASSAMNLAAKGGWRGLSMDLVEHKTEDSAFEWIEKFLQAYESRLDEKYRAPVLALVRARAAFFQQDFRECADQLDAIGNQPAEFSGQDIRQLRLMAYYELLYCQLIADRPRARQLVPDPRAVLAQMRSNLKFLRVDKERKTFQLDFYQNFIDGFSALLTLKERAEKLPENSPQRVSMLIEAKPGLLAMLQNKSHFSGEWLRRQAKNLY